VFALPLWLGRRVPVLRVGVRAVRWAGHPGCLEGAGVAVRGLWAPGRLGVAALLCVVPGRVVPGRKTPPAVGCGGTSGVGDPARRPQGSVSAGKVIVPRTGLRRLCAGRLLPGTLGGRIVPTRGVNFGVRVGALVLGALRL